MEQVRNDDVLATLIAAQSGGAAVEEVLSQLPQGRLTDAQVLDWIGLNPSEKIFMLAHPMDHPALLHRHDFYEFSYAYRGTIINVVDGQRIFMLPDTLCVMNLDSTHALEIASPEATIVNLCIRKSMFDEGVFHEFLESDTVMTRFLRGEGNRHALFFSDVGDHSLASAIALLAREYVHGGHRQTFALAGHTLAFLDTLAHSSTYSFHGMNSTVMSILAYIRDRCDTVTVGQIAREFGYSNNYCTQYIKRHTGRSASELIADARVARAESLLRTSDLAISAVARAVGYRSVGHFNELFRNRHGMTPGEYRMLYRAVQ